MAEFQSRAEENYGQELSNTATTTFVEPTAVKPVFYEGSTRTIELTIHERDPAARYACIAHFGVTCQICGFDFEEVYGELGRGFIHVHHKSDMALSSEQLLVDPIHDLIPVCPNCHAMLHTQKLAMSDEVLRELILSCRK